MRACLLCDSATPVVGVLCVDCAGSLSGSERLCPEQIVCLVDEDDGAALIDRWGRVHALARRTVVGRQVAEGISIAEAAISREHTLFECDSDGRWFVSDLGSTNGTFVNGERLAGRRELHSADEIHCADVAFCFVVPEDGLPADLPVVVGTTLKPDLGLQALGASLGLAHEREEDTYTGLSQAAVELHEPSGGGGGVLVVDGTTVQLTASQFALIRILVQRMESDGELPEIIRGFVRSSELIEALPWDTPYPDENHLKQLVRRVRRALAKVELTDLIESRHRFGYRLAVVPRSL